MLHQAGNARHVGRDHRQPRRHRFQQHARDAFARLRRQNERVVALVERHQLIERHGPAQGHAGADAEAQGLRGDAIALLIADLPDRGPDDVDGDVVAVGDERGHRLWQDAQALARVDAAHREQPDRRRPAGVAARRDVLQAQCRGFGFEHRGALPLVFLAQGRAVGKGQRPRRHVAQRPLFKRDIGAKQRLLGAAIRQVRQQRSVIAHHQQEHRFARRPREAEGKDGRRRRHAQVNHVALPDPLAQPAVEERQHRVELPRTGEIGQRRQPHV